MLQNVSGSLLSTGFYEIVSHRVGPSACRVVFTRDERGRAFVPWNCRPSKRFPIRAYGPPGVVASVSSETDIGDRYRIPDYADDDALSCQNSAKRAGNRDYEYARTRLLRLSPTGTSIDVFHLTNVGQRKLRLCGQTLFGTIIIIMLRRLGHIVTEKPDGRRGKLTHRPNRITDWGGRPRKIRSSGFGH